MTLLSILEDVTEELSLPVPSEILLSTDPQVRQLLKIANRQGRELVRNHEWAELTTTFTFTTTADPHVETFPNARDRALSRAKLWRNDSLTPLEGPLTSAQWQFLVDRFPGNFPGYWRNIGNALNIVGIGIGAELLTEYVSNEWVRNNADTVGFTQFQADDDNVLVPEELMILGLVWRWRHRKGLEYAEDMQTYQRQLELAIAADRSAKPVSMARRINDNREDLTFRGQIVVN